MHSGSRARSTFDSNLHRRGCGFSGLPHWPGLFTRSTESYLPQTPKVGRHTASNDAGKLGPLRRADTTSHGARGKRKNVGCTALRARYLSVCVARRWPIVRPHPAEIFEIVRHILADDEPVEMDIPSAKTRLLPLDSRAHMRRGRRAM